MAKNVWALSLPLGESQGTLKALIRPTVEELGFTVLSPAGGRSTLIHFLLHHPWEAELRLGKDKGLACGHTAQEAAEPT